MANTYTEQLELMVESLQCLQYGASKMGLEDLFHLLGVAELEAQDILQNVKPNGKCDYGIPENTIVHLNQYRVKRR